MTTPPTEIRDRVQVLTGSSTEVSLRTRFVYKTPFYSPSVTIGVSGGLRESDLMDQILLTRRSSLPSKSNALFSFKWAYKPIYFIVLDHQLFFFGDYGDSLETRTTSNDKDQTIYGMEEKLSRADFPQATRK